jgi:hypothetical protein
MDLPVTDLTGAPDPARAAADLLLEQARIPFDLAAGPPLRFLLLRTGPDEHRLLRLMRSFVTGFQRLLGAACAQPDRPMLELLSPTGREPLALAPDGGN